MIQRRRGVRLKFENETFGKGARVPLDGNEFTDCVFNETTLVFGATGIAFSLNNCRLEKVTFEFVGSANMMIEFLRMMYLGFGPVGADLLDQIVASVKVERSAKPALDAPKSA
jgi:hypothetical protein